MATAELPLSTHGHQVIAGQVSLVNSPWEQLAAGSQRESWASKQAGRAQNGGSGWDLFIFTPPAVATDTKLSSRPFRVQAI